MITLLHISDLHFGPHYLPQVGEALLRAAPALQPDLIVASGDFTQRAKPDQFAEARAFLDRLPAVPCAVVPGNHDVPLYRIHERLFSPLALYRRHIAAELNSVLRHEKAVVAALDSTSPHLRVTGGRLRRWQLEFCQQAFHGAPPGALRVVVAHHPLAPPPDYEHHQSLWGARRALDCFGDLGVDLVLGGHLHRAFIANSLDVNPGHHRRHGIVIAQCGTTTSRRGRAREREKNSFNLILAAAETIRVTHYMYFAEEAGFAPISQHVFPRSPRPFLAP